MIEFQLHGPLAEGFDKPIKMSVNTPQMFFRGLDCNYPEYTQRLRDFEDRTGRGMSIICIDEDGKASSINPNFLNVPFRSNIKSVHIVPEVAGAGIEAAAAAIVAWIGVGAAYVAVATVIVTIAINIAIGLVLGAIASVLAPSPSTANGSDKPSERASLIFNGPVNTTAQGGAVPLVYGLHLTGSVQISVGVNVEDIPPPPVVIDPMDLDGNGIPDVIENVF